MKILITNTVLLNTGDAAILIGVLKILRLAFQEEVEFTIYDKNPDIAKKYYPELQFRQSLYFSLTKEFKKLSKFFKYNSFLYSFVVLETQFIFC
jgi:colanic acid/amylovoran biosynthesis protein